MENPSDMNKVLSRALPYLKPNLKNGEASTGIPFRDLPVTRQFDADLIITYLLDGGDTFKYVQNRDLGGAGLTKHQLHDLSLRNLSFLAEDKLEVQAYGAVNVFLMGGHFEASLLLLDELWEKKLVYLAPNGFLVAAPARDVLAVCDIESNRGMAELRAIVNRAQSAGHLITPVLLRREIGRWIRHLD
jgi:uncharacterized protein YtpQ (UPF0354 family)